MYISYYSAYNIEYWWLNISAMHHISNQILHKAGRWCYTLEHYNIVLKRKLFYNLCLRQLLTRYFNQNNQLFKIRKIKNINYSLKAILLILLIWYIVNSLLRLSHCQLLTIVVQIQHVPIYVHVFILRAAVV